MTSGDVNSAARLLVIGGGYTGLRLARAAAQQGTEVWLTHRSEQAPAATAPLEEQLHWLRFDADQGCVPQLPAGLTQDVVTLTPASSISDAASAPSPYPPPPANHRISYGFVGCCVFFFIECLLYGFLC